MGNKLKRTGIAAAIAVLSVLLIGLFVDAIFEEPKWEDYCDEKRYPFRSAPEKTCPDSYTKEVADCQDGDGTVHWKYDADGCESFESCDMCSQKWDKDVESNNKFAFYLGAALSLLVLIIGLVWHVEFIGTGFMFGGIMGLFYSTVRYFVDLDKWVRIIVILVELGIVLGLAYLRLVNQEKKEAEQKVKPKSRKKRKK